MVCKKNKKFMKWWKDWGKLKWPSTKSNANVWSSFVVHLYSPWSSSLAQLIISRRFRCSASAMNFFPSILILTPSCHHSTFTSLSFTSQTNWVLSFSNTFCDFRKITKVCRGSENEMNFWWCATNSLIFFFATGEEQNFVPIKAPNSINKL